MITADRKQLCNAFASIAGITTKTQIIPVLACQRWGAEGGVLTIEGTNLDVMAAMAVPASGEIDICLDVERLRAFLAVARADSVTVETDGNIAKLSCGKARASIPFLLAEFWPRLIEPDTPEPLTVSGKDLLTATKFARPAISSDKDRAYLGGVHLKPGAGSLLIEACDGVRWYCTAIPASGALSPRDESSSIIVPLAALDLIAADDCQIGASDSVIVFRQGSKKIASKMIAGKYPDMIARIGYNSQEFGRELIADRDSLLSAAKACVSMDLSSNYGTSVHVFADDGEAVLFASRGDGNTIEIPFEAHGDSVADFVLGARYLVDALSVIPAETVKIRSGEPSYVAITWSGDGRIVTYRQRPKPWHMKSRGKFGEAA